MVFQFVSNKAVLYKVKIYKLCNYFLIMIEKLVQALDQTVAVYF